MVEKINPDYLYNHDAVLIDISVDELFITATKLLNSLLADNLLDSFSMPSVQIRISALHKEAPDCVSSNQPPVADRLLLGFKEAASLLSMTEQALRDLVHKGQGPETVKRGKRVCFTNEGLRHYVSELPRESPHGAVVEAITSRGSKALSIEERRAFGD